METAAAGPAGRSAKDFPASVRSACLAAAAVAACPWSWAQQPPPARDAPLRIELRSEDVLRLDTADGPLSGARLSVMPPTRSAVGLSLGLNASSAAGTYSLAPDTQRRAFDVGVHLRHTLQNHQIDVMAWKRLQPQDAYTLAQMQQPTYGARVELNLAPASRAAFIADRGFLGVQLQGGGRITLKRKDGRPMVYYRTTF